MEGNGRKAFIISAFLALAILTSQSAITTLKRATSASTNMRNHYKNLLLFDLALKDGQLSGQTPGSNTRTYLIQGTSQKGDLAGQSILQTVGTGKDYTLSVRATLKAPPAAGKKYVIWLKDPAGTEAIAVGNGAGATVTVDSFKANRDLTPYSVILTQEDANVQATAPSTTREVEATQQTGNRPTVAPTAGPTTAPGQPTVAPTTAPGQPGQPTSAPTQPTQPTAAPTTPPSQAPLSGEALNTEIKKAIDAVDESNIRSNLENLVDDDSSPQKDEKQNRVTQKPGNAKEAEFIKGYFEAHGIDAAYQDFTQGGYTSRNIIGSIYGTDRNSWYIVMAHMDSIVLNTPGWKETDPAPGADDNGSGTSAVMEIARAIKESGAKLDSSLLFILFSGEEEGRLGSQYYASNSSLQGVNGILNLDMIGNRGPVDNCVNAQYKPRTGGNLIADEFVAINNQFNLGLTTTSSDDYIEWSDHHWFIQKGIMGSFLHECTMSPNWHKLTDTTDALSYPQITKTAKAVAGTLVKVSHTKLGKGFADGSGVLGTTEATQEEAPLLIKAYYSVDKGPNELFELSEIPINYYEGGHIPQPFFLGLFSEKSYTKVQNLGYSTQVIDDNTNLDLYELLWYPVEGGRILIDQATAEGAGTFTELSPQLFLLKYTTPHEFKHEGSLAGFFDIELPTHSAPPTFDTPRITPVPVSSTPTQTPRWPAIIAVIFGFAAICMVGVAIYLHRASRT